MSKKKRVFLWIRWVLACILVPVGMIISTAPLSLWLIFGIRAVGYEGAMLATVGCAITILGLTLCPFFDEGLGGTIAEHRFPWKKDG